MHRFKSLINSKPYIKNIIHRALFSKRDCCPRLWVKIFINPFFLSYSKGSKIKRHVIMNVSPVNEFFLGKKSVIESFSILDNGVGGIHIGDNVRIGLNNTLIGPLEIGNHTILGQNVTVSALNHNYKDPNCPIRNQNVNSKSIIIGSESWIGANCVILAGIKIGKHTVIGAGSVVTKDISDYSVAVGNPAKIIKRYNFSTKEWERV